MSDAHDDVKDRAKDLQADFKALAKDVRKLAVAVGGEARQEFDDFAHLAQARGEDAYRSVSQTVKERPGLALGVAAGVGVLVGLLLSSRR